MIGANLIGAGTGLLVPGAIIVIDGFKLLQYFMYLSFNARVL